MVLKRISNLVQMQWQQLCSAIDTKGHEHRGQQRLEKKQAKQQRKAARRAMREARRAQRKERITLLSSTVIDEHKNNEPETSSNETTSSSSGDKQSKGALETSGKTCACTAEALLANDRSIFSKQDTNGERWDTLQGTSLEIVGVRAVYDQSAESKVTVLEVTAAPQLPIELALEIETQLHQKQRKFHDSLGGYSTVDEEEDELHELRVRSHRASDAMLPTHLDVFRSKGTTAIPQMAKKDAILRQPEAAEQERGNNVSMAVSQASSASSLIKLIPQSLKRSVKLVKTDIIDDKVEQSNINGCSIFNGDDKSCLSFVAHDGLDELCEFSNSRLVAEDRMSDVVTVNGSRQRLASSWNRNEFDMSIDGRVEAFAEIGGSFEVKLSTEKHCRVLNVPTLSASRQSSTSHVNFSSKDVCEVLDQLYEIPNRKTEDEQNSFEAVVRMTEIRALDSVVEAEKKVIAGKFAELDDGTFCRETSLLDSPYQPLPMCTIFSELYSSETINEYASSNYESLRAREHRYHVTEDIFSRQQSVGPKMRAVLVDWLVEVHQRFELETQTLFLTINYIDRYLAQMPVKSQRFQLVGIAALLIASKYEEIYPCDMDDLLYICERSYAKTDLVECERNLLNIFKFNLAVPSISSFISYYLAHFEDSDELVGQLASYFAESSLLDFTFGATYEPSIIGSSCLLAAHCYVKSQTPALVWSSRLVELTGYAVEAIIPCTRDLWSILIQPCELTAVATKYSAKEFGEVANFPLEDLAALLY